MTMQVLPPELLADNKITTQEPQPYWKPSSRLKMESLKNFASLDVTKPGMRLLAGNMLRKQLTLRRATYALTVISLLALIQVTPLILPEKPTGPNLTVPKSTEALSNLVVSSHGLLPQQHVAV